MMNTFSGFYVSLIEAKQRNMERAEQAKQKRK